MRGTALDVRTSADGSVVVRPHGMVGLDAAVELRQVLVHTVRKVRPLRLVLDLADVSGIDPINLGTLAAACGLGDDHHVIVFLDNSSETIAAQLTAAGVPRQRMRHRPTVGDRPPVTKVTGGEAQLCSTAPVTAEKWLD
jgi:anti-anti-sigma regulatory factor